MREELHEVSFEHARRGHEQPVGRINDLHVALVVEVPDLRHEGALRIDDPRDLFFECSYHHGVGHDEGERMVKLHLLLDVF